VLAAWSGLGYYSRARNLRKAAQQVVARGSFPADYESIRRLPGVGDYTAAAIASIAFDLPRAVMDGNVRRVLSRVTCQADRLDVVAASLVVGPRPGQFNQAVMELGATVCLPGEPLCPVCPVSGFCEAKRQGRQREFPVKLPRPTPVRVAKTLLLAEKNGKILLWKREEGPRMRGFWELPEAGELPGALLVRRLAEFRHSITNHNYVFTLVEARVRRAPAGFRWVAEGELGDLPLSTVARKALAFRGP
jgi:A/G-specific adenine glycosylase